MNMVITPIGTFKTKDSFYIIREKLCDVEGIENLEHYLKRKLSLEEKNEVYLKGFKIFECGD
jgi:hypothetical protein